MYPQGDHTFQSPYPRGPPMTDMTNVHSGSIPLHAANNYVGPLNMEDERGLVQVFFDMIMQETAMEKQKESLAE